MVACAHSLIEKSLDTRNLVMVVDDDPGFRRSVGRVLRQSGYETLLFPTAEAFEAQHDFGEAVCVLLDIDLGERSGIEVRKQLKARNNSIQVIYMTRNDDPIVPTAALQLRVPRLSQQTLPGTSAAGPHPEGCGRLMAELSPLRLAIPVSLDCRLF